MGFYFQTTSLSAVTMRLLHISVLQVLRHYENLSCRNIESGVCESTSKMQWNRGRLQVCYYEALFLPSLSRTLLFRNFKCVNSNLHLLNSQSTHCIPNRSPYSQVHISLILSLLHNCNQIVRRGKVGPD
jgi:hypothetical protein